MMEAFEESLKRIVSLEYDATDKYCAVYRVKLACGHETTFMSWPWNAELLCLECVRDEAGEENRKAG